MASPTTRLELSKQVLDENPDTWGDVLNVNFDILDLAVAGRSAVTVLAGASYTLTDDNYEADESRALFIDVTVTGSGTGTIVAPNREKLYIVRNAHASNLVAFSAGVNPTAGKVTVAAQSIAVLYSDGTSVYVVYRTWGLANTITPTGTTALINTFADSAHRADSVRLLFKGLSHASGTPTIDIAISDDQVNWSSYQALSASTFGTSATLYGAVEITGCQQDAGLISATLADLTSNRTMGTLARNEIAWRLATGIYSARFQAGGANFDAGTVETWVR